MQLQGIQTPSLNDPRGQQGILARGKPNYMGSNAAPGAGRPQEGGNLRFDTEVLQRRLAQNAAQYGR
jgi:hypothetical protein